MCEIRTIRSRRGARNALIVTRRPIWKSRSISITERYIATHLERRCVTHGRVSLCNVTVSFCTKLGQPTVGYIIASDYSWRLLVNASTLCKPSPTRLLNINYSPPPCAVASAREQPVVYQPRLRFRYRASGPMYAARDSAPLAAFCKLAPTTVADYRREIPCRSRIGR